MRIDRLRLLSLDPAGLVAFYRSVFGADPLDSGVALGEERIEIAQVERPDRAEFAANETGFQHFAIVVADIDAAYGHLRGFGGWRPISLRGPEHLPKTSGRGAAFKFRDPCGHPLELLQFAPGSVSPHWGARFAAAQDRLFHGLDHTALTVSDADASRAFYARLGFECAHRHINAGAEQRRLDGIADARDVSVEILSLLPADGARPGIELLAYREPPVVSRSADHGAPAATCIVISGDAVQERLVRDLDGHRLEIAGPRTSAPIGAVTC
jgi:catechol 2,3-dioxygenase-like lactoylglutathione lyase family enzyme